MADITEVKVSKFCTVQENIADSTYIAKIIDGKFCNKLFRNGRILPFVLHVVYSFLHLQQAQANSDIPHCCPSDGC